MREGMATVTKREPLVKDGEGFGVRMARLRKAAGYSQRELAAELGISQRMIAYYEKQTQYPPTHLLPVFAKAVGVSADQLLGMEKTEANSRTKDTRLWRRFSQIGKMDPKERRQISLLLDTFIEKDRLKRKEK